MNTNILCRRLSLALLISSIAASRLAMAHTENGTLTVGRYTESCGSPQISFFFVDGYSTGLSIGSYSPTGLIGGETVIEIADELSISCPNHSTLSLLEVSGFSSNPGSSWLTSVTCNGVTNDASAASYSYNSGVAEWVWSQLFGLAEENGTNVGCTIIHN